MKTFKTVMAYSCSEVFNRSKSTRKLLTLAFEYKILTSVNYGEMIKYICRIQNISVSFVDMSCTLKSVGRNCPPFSKNFVVSGFSFPPYQKGHFFILLLFTFPF